MDAPKTLQVRVSQEADGYREVARTTEIEVQSVARDEERVSVAAKPLRPSGRFWRPTLIALAGVLPALFLLTELNLFPDHNTWPIRIEALTVLLVGLGSWIVAFRHGERVNKNISAALPPPEGSIEQVRIEVRSAQGLTLVGRVHRIDGGHEKEVTRVRVEESIVDGRVTLLADYVDGTEGVLLADLTEGEADEVRACARAHAIEVDE